MTLSICAVGSGIMLLAVMTTNWLLNGELQYYNSTLCLSRIVEEADACLLFSNDDILSIMSKRLAKKIGLPALCPV